MMKVLSTRILDKEMEDYARSLNLNLHCIDFISQKEIVFNLNSIHPNQFDAIIFTSANGVNYFLQNKNAIQFLNLKNIFSLSGKTHQTLLLYNIKPMHVSKNSNDLADSIIQSKNIKSVLHVCGNLVLNNLEEKLNVSGFIYKTLNVYQTILHNEILLDENFDAVLFFSPSGVESFLASNKLHPQTICCCIGTTTANTLKEKYPSIKIIIPAEPLPGLMLDAIAHHYKTINIYE